MSSNKVFKELYKDGTGENIKERYKISKVTKSITVLAIVASISGALCFVNRVQDIDLNYNELVAYSEDSDSLMNIVYRYDIDTVNDMISLKEKLDLMMLPNDYNNDSFSLYKSNLYLRSLEELELNTDTIEDSITKDRYMTLLAAQSNALDNSFNKELLNDVIICSENLLIEGIKKSFDPSFNTYGLSFEINYLESIIVISDSKTSNVYEMRVDKSSTLGLLFRRIASSKDVLTDDLIDYYDEIVSLNEAIKYVVATNEFSNDGVYFISESHKDVYQRILI